MLGVVLAAALLTAGQPAAAPSDAPRVTCSTADATCRGLAVADVFALAEKLVQEHRKAEAESLLKVLTADPNIDYRSEARFRLAQLRTVAGDYLGAARLLRTILEEKPDTGRVRLELAAVLAKMGDETAARRQLNRAEAGGLPADILPLVDRFRLALRARRRLGANIEVGLAPNSNLNRGTTDRTIQLGDVSLTLDRDARARSGVGAMVASQFFWRPALSAKVDALTTVSELANVYREHRFDDVAISFGQGVAMPLSNGRLTTSATVGRRWFGGRPYSTSYGPTASWLGQIGRASQIQLDLSAYHVRYIRNPFESGSQLSAAVAIEHAFSPRFYGRLQIRVDRQIARSPAYSSWTAGAEALLSRDIGGRAVYAKLGLWRTIADAPFTLPPERRDDRLFTAEAGVQFRRVTRLDLVPVIRVTHADNRSPIVFYRYRQERIAFGLIRDI